MIGVFEAAMLDVLQTLRIPVVKSETRTLSLAEHDVQVRVTLDRGVLLIASRGRDGGQWSACILNSANMKNGATTQGDVRDAVRLCVKRAREEADFDIRLAHEVQCALVPRVDDKEEFER